MNNKKVYKTPEVSITYFVVETADTNVSFVTPEMPIDTSSTAKNWMTEDTQE